MEYRIHTRIPPEQVLERANRHFALEWRYGGNYKRGDDFVKLVKGAGLGRTFLAVFGIGSEVDVAQVAVYSEGDKTLVVILSNRRDWANALRLWAETELEGERVTA